jgi:hypothetical protein
MSLIDEYRPGQSFDEDLESPLWDSVIADAILEIENAD